MELIAVLLILLVGLSVIVFGMLKFTEDMSGPPTEHSEKVNVRHSGKIRRKA